MQKIVFGLSVGLFLAGAAIMDATADRGGQEAVVVAAASAVQVERLD